MIALFVRTPTMSLRYASEARISLIGFASRRAVLPASFTVSSLTALPTRTCSVLRALMGVGATAPRAILASWQTFLSLLIRRKTANGAEARIIPEGRSMLLAGDRLIVFGSIHKLAAFKNNN